MDTTLIGYILGFVGTVIAAFLAWHAATVTARREKRNTAQDAAERTLEAARADLEAARAETAEERQHLLELRDKRLEEMANQLGSARMSLAEERHRRKELEAVVEGLERRIAVCDEQLEEYRRRLADLEVSNRDRP